MKLAMIIGAASTAVLLTAMPVAAQDWDEDATYGSAVLASGFQPDPHIVSLTAGGSIDSSQSVSGSCRGFVANAPDFDLLFSPGSGSLPLAISAGSNSDVTLLINTPDGRWHCDDDSGSGTNAAIVFNNPQQGLYNIWVGTYNGSTAPAQLSISELQTY